MPDILPVNSALRAARIEVHQLFSWFASAERDLPWRAGDVTPWQILVSEFMLQQTPVARVLPIWPDWVARWPTPSATADASQADILRAWGKLGYPRRAKRLHECATVIAREFADVVPDDVDVLQQLPGIGSYTARAIASFAYGRRVPVVDTNVRRVVARAVHGLPDAGAPSTKRDHADVEALLPKADQATRFSAALMELGAIVCTARSPRCDDCPLRHSCSWRLAGSPPGTGPKRPAQRYAGTDRQVRGRLLDVLRDNAVAVTRADLDLAWPADAVQRERALTSLLGDGLVEQLADGRFALPGQDRNDSTASR
ncbi:A/G-specific adenine glycosylase [Mycolicibacter virginiensis]|uniref:Adenine DNA glycosylase n=1 Tax=Mycolicibacter virginiensis TaxID=1795032 RepID=A0A9X7NYQ6_9MYCO|nr:MULTISPECIES: A/G-specific adenine glycosylase [Mycobacteriaceae]PQM52252.1 A/G-specific adenine glycosylase [Mycolicibacter virginiensis]ULP47224.1 A/G-specific adenine glycosylase [Mycolicibacter virginiensis]